jgi:tryptophan synthase alpha chain
MANRYTAAFDALKERGQKAFIPFTVLGYPDRLACLASIDLMVECGATALELGIAFSDPVADGPTIQHCANEVIASGFGLEDAFELVGAVRRRHREIPIGLLAYYNTVMCRGVDWFYARANEAGVDGVLIADLPPESANQAVANARANEIQQIFIVSPLTTRTRLTRVLQNAGGFVYAVSRLGVTGVEEEHDSNLREIIRSVHERTQLPVCVGFGVSSPQQAGKIFNLGADGVISGSRVIELSGADAAPGLLGNYLQEMASSCREAGKVNQLFSASKPDDGREHSDSLYVKGSCSEKQVLPGIEDSRPGWRRLN